jgi:HEAT repeats
MSIPLLRQVYEEVRRLSIAGSIVAPGDFRLKKLVAPLEQAGQKAPVFARVAQAVNRVVESDDRTSGEALLDLSTLINAILYTQGETGQEGELERIETAAIGLQVTQTSARVLKPLLDALTTTGSGRLEIIKDAHDRGAFLDLRLIRPTLSALDDSYPEIADFVTDHVLPLYGNAIFPELRTRFDPKGRGGHIRRLSLMHQLDPVGTREIVKHALEAGSKEIRVAAIECLGESPEDLLFLLDQARSKSKDVRQAALKALSRSDSTNAVATLRSAFESDDIELAVPPVQSSRIPEVLKFVLEIASRQRDTLLKTKGEDKKEVGKQVTRFLSQLECLRGRNDTDTETFVRECFDKRKTLAAIKGDVGGKDIQQKLVSIMAVGSKRSKEVVAEAHATLSVLELNDAFHAACQVWEPKRVYDRFNSYLALKRGQKSKNADQGAKQAAITAVLTGQQHGRRSYLAPGGMALVGAEAYELDPRWLDLAVELKDPELVQALARPGHPAANQFLTSSFEEILKKSKTSYEFGSILATMVRIQHPAAIDSLIAAIKKCANDTYVYGLSWLGQLIPNLSKEALPKLDALLSTLPEKAVDQLLDHVTQLKNKI